MQQKKLLRCVTSMGMSASEEHESDYVFLEWVHKKRMERDRRSPKKFSVRESDSVCVRACITHHFAQFTHAHAHTNPQKKRL